MNRQTVSWTLALLGSLTMMLSPVSEAVTINDGMEHDINSPIGDDDLVIADGGGGASTTVNLVTGGSVGRDVQVFDTSILNMLDGSIGQALDVHDSAVATVFGGTIGDGINTFGNSTLNLLGGSYGSEDMTFFDNSSVFMSGGVGEEFVASDDVVGLITGGSLEAIFANDMAHVTVEGLASIVNDIQARGSANIQIFGGNLAGGEDLESEGTAVIDIFGLAFNLPFGPIAALSGDLTGTLLDGSPISFEFSRDSSAAIILHGPPAVPEPATLLLVMASFVALAVARRR